MARRDLLRYLRFSGALFGAGFFLSGCASLTQVPQAEAAIALTDGNYQLDPSHAALTFHISHFGVSSYMGRFTDIEAELDFDADNPSAARLDAAVNVASLHVTPAGFAATLTGPDWLDADQFPSATFRSNGLTLTGENRARVDGVLTLHGVSQAVSFDTEFSGGARNPASGHYAIGFDARAQIKRSDFGITKLLSVAGDKFDFDSVELRFNGEFIRQ